MSKKGQLKITPMLAKLSRYPGLQKQVMEPILKRQAGLIISSGGKVKGVVQATPPYKLDEADTQSVARKRGEGAVAAGIRKVYGTPGDLYALIKKRVGKGMADNFWAYYKTGRQEDASRIAQQATGFKLAPFDSGRAHKERRNSKGRVGGNFKSIFVADLHRVESYIKSRQQNVGYLASSLVGPGERKLGSLPSVPAWVRRHSAAFGEVLLLETPTGERVRMTIKAPYGGIQMQRLFDSVVSYRARAFQRELPTALRKAVRAALR